MVRAAGRVFYELVNILEHAYLVQSNSHPWELQSGTRTSRREVRLEGCFESIDGTIISSTQFPIRTLCSAKVQQGCTRVGCRSPHPMWSSYRPRAGEWANQSKTAHCIVVRYTTIAVALSLLSSASRPFRRLLSLPLVSTIVYCSFVSCTATIKRLCPVSSWPLSIHMHSQLVVVCTCEPSSLHWGSREGEDLKHELSHIWCVGRIL